MARGKLTSGSNGSPIPQALENLLMAMRQQVIATMIVANPEDIRGLQGQIKVIDSLLGLKTQVNPDGDGSDPHQE